MCEVSLFNSLGGKPYQNIDIDTALNRIKSGHNIKHIEALREAHAKNDKAKKDYIKKNDLWSVTFAGTFKTRNANDLIKSSGLLILDFDHVPSPEFFKQYHFDNYDHVYAAWISPSGDGVKMLIRIPDVDSDKEYKLYYNSVLKYFDTASCDNSTKDICRLAFESYDPNLLQREWDKVSIWEEKEDDFSSQNKPVKIDNQKQHDIDRILDVASSMIKNSPDGQKHFTLLKASRLLGGYVASSTIDEQLAIDLLETEIQNRNIVNFKSAQKAIRDGLKFGKLSPIYHNFRVPYNENIKVEFPIDIFPDLYKNLILKLEDNLNFPIDFTAISILFCYSVIMGNKFAVKVKNGYQTVPICWFAIVGNPGVSKSHPVNLILKPINDWDFNSYKQYELDKKEWEEVENNRTPKPKFKKHLIDDFTIESLANIIKANSNGIGIYADELASWISNIDRYSNSNNMSKFLSIFDNGSLKVDRKTMDPEYVRNVFLSIIGTIQPDILLDLFEKYSSNGFVDRFLFAYPDVEVKPLPIEDYDIPELTEHNNLIGLIINKLGLIGDNVYQFEDMTKFSIIDKWLIEQSKDVNTNVRMLTYIGKLRGYIPRLAIIIENINSIVINDITPTTITTDSVLKTFDLIKYFFTIGEKLLVDFNKKKETKSIINGYKFNYEKVNALRSAGYQFKEIGKILSISEQVAKNYSKKVTKK